MGPQQVRMLSTAQEAGLWKSVGLGETAVSHIPDSHTEHRRHACSSAAEQSDF